VGVGVAVAEVLKEALEAELVRLRRCCCCCCEVCESSVRVTEDCEGRRSLVMAVRLRRERERERARERKERGKEEGE